jgi:hypothetical protein
MASVCENDAVSKFSSTQYTAVVVRAASSRQDSLAKFSDAVHAVAAAEVTRSFLSLAGLYGCDRARLLASSGPSRRSF